MVTTSTNISFNKYSMYKNTTSSGSLRNYFNPITIDKDEETDTEYTIEEKYNEMPGLLAYDLYGSANLKWIFMYYNRDVITDMIYDFKTGITIITPQKARLLTILGL